MANILQIETSTGVCAVAISINGKTVASKEAAEKNAHASKLTLFIDEVMQEAKLTYQDLDAVAVGMGPGSYTGLRIGVSTAKGICFAIDKPLIAISTLELMAQGFIQSHPNAEGFICPMIDARRMEVYTAIYNLDLEEVKPVAAEIIDASSFSDLLASHKITFIGDGAMKCAETIQSSNASFTGDNFNSAANMSLLAARKFENRKFEDVAYFEPFYLKDFVLTQPKKLF